MRKHWLPRTGESKVIDPALVEKLPLVIAIQDSAHYYEIIWQTATQSQKALLIALADDLDALPFSRDFQVRHGIGPASSIKASLVSLLNKGIVYKTLENQYRFVDRFMPYWIKSIRK
jgi:hypothetical protein